MLKRVEQRNKSGRWLRTIEQTIAESTPIPGNLPNNLWEFSKYKIIRLTLSTDTVLNISGVSNGDTGTIVFNPRGYSLTVPPNSVWVDDGIGIPYENAVHIVMFLFDNGIFYFNSAKYVPAVTPFPPPIDFDGNEYDYVEFAGLYITTTPLITTRYMDGTLIDPADGLVHPIDPRYGWLYSKAAADSSRKLISGSWRLPTYEDWSEIVETLNPAAFILPQPPNGEILRSLLDFADLYSDRQDPDDHPRWNFPGFVGTNTLGINLLPNGSGDLAALATGIQSTYGGNNTVINFFPSDVGVFSWWESVIFPYAALIFVKDV